MYIKILNKNSISFTLWIQNLKSNSSQFKTNINHHSAVQTDHRFWENIPGILKRTASCHLNNGVKYFLIQYQGLYTECVLKISDLMIMHVKNGNTFDINQWVYLAEGYFLYSCKHIIRIIHAPNFVWPVVFES